MPEHNCPIEGYAKSYVVSDMQTRNGVVGFLLIHTCECGSVIEKFEPLEE